MSIKKCRDREVLPTFHDPQGRGSCAKLWPYKPYSKNALFLKMLIFFSTAEHRSDKLSIYTVIMINKEGFTKTVKFMTPWERVVVLGCGHVGLW